MIVSVLLYGIEGRCVMSKTAQAKLNVVQTKAIRICVGLLRCTANPVTLIEGEEMPLKLQQMKRLFKYWLKRRLVLGVDVESVRSKIFSRELAMGEMKGIYDKFESIREKWNIKVNSCICKVPYWKLEKTTFDYRAAGEGRGAVSHQERRFIAEEIIKVEYKEYIKVFTDASRKSGKVGLGICVVEKNMNALFRIDNEIGIFHAELLGIYLAILWLKSECSKEKLAVVFTDSLSSIKYLEGSKDWYKESIGLRIINSIHFLYQVKRIRVSICYVPAHVGVVGNELADKAAKRACEKDIVDIWEKKLVSELNDYVGRHCREEGEKVLGAAIQKMPYYQDVLQKSRRDIKMPRDRCMQFILSRLRANVNNLAYSRWKRR